MKKKIGFSILVLILAGFIALWYAHHLVVRHAEKKVFSRINEVPKVRVGMVLGTIKTLKNGQENYYFSYRIAAAAALYKAGKIERLVVSGDNSSKDYDESTDMKAALIAQGLDSTHIYVDYAGFRTFDSMKRLQEIFGQDTAIVISQKFHNERAVYIGDKLGMTVYGYNAKDVSKHMGMKTNIREYLARVKMLLDFYMGVEPKFLGEKVEIY